MTKIKNLLCILALCLVFPGVFLFSACGDDTSTPDDNGPSVINVTVDVNPASAYYNKYDSTQMRFNFESSDVWNFTKSDFVVTAYFSDGTSQVTNNYTLTIDTTPSVVDDYDIYTIHFGRENESYTYSLSVYVEHYVEQLPNLTGVTYSEGVYTLNQELRYTGAQQDALDYIGTDEAGVTIQSLIDASKIEVQELDSNMAHAAIDANWVDGLGNYQQYYFVLKANQGYCWMEGNNKVDTLSICFTIKRQILQTPTLTSTSTTLTYQHIFDPDTNQYVGVPQGLVYDLHGNGAYITQSEQQTDVRNDYEWNISINYDDRDNYTFLVNGVEQDYLDAVSWSIVPMRIGINEIVINDPTHYDSTTQSYRYTYTGSEILPTTNIPNDIINAFNISGCTYASVNAQNLTIQVKDYLLQWDSVNDVYTLKNYAWQNGAPIVLGDSSYLYLEYYIDQEQTVAPAGFANNNVQIKEQTYELSGNLLGWLFLNPRQIGNIENLAFTDDSYAALNALNMFDGTFEWDVEQPYSTSLVVGNNSLTIKWFATTDIDNYIPIDIPVTIVLNPRVLNLEANWYTPTSGEYPTLWLSNSYDNAVSEGITYTTYYDLNNYATATQAANYTDAGYYTTVATLPVNANYVYKDNANNTITSFTNEWRVYPTNIGSAYSTWSWTTSTPNAGTPFNGFISFYTDDTDDRTMTYDTSQFSDDLKTYYKIADASYVTYIYNAGTDEWSVAQNTHAIGTYKTVLTIPFDTTKGKATNYCVNDGYFNNANNDAEFESPEWEIMPASYTFQTTNSNAANYLGWPATDPVFTCDGNNHVPTLDLPSGLYLDYMIDHNPTYDAEHGTWQHSGSSSSYEPSDVGDYLFFADVKIRQVYGSASVTFTVDGGAAVTTYDLPDLHFSIAEPTPTNYTYDNNNFSMTPVDGYNYITFTTPNVAADYIMLSSAPLNHGWIWIRPASSTAYTTVYGAVYTTGTYYYVFTGLSAETAYVVKFGYSTYNSPSTLHLWITQYDNKVSYVDGENSDYYVDGLTSALTNADTSLISNACGIDIVNSLPYGSNNKSVTKINANAFNAETKTDMGLNLMTTVIIPDSVTEIGANAFKGCSNLTTVIFGGGYWHWAETMNDNKIIFGQDCFAGCSQDLTIYFVSDAQYGSQYCVYHLNADGTLGDPIEIPQP